MRSTPCPLVAVEAFVAATRDTGYKSTASAIAELIDNAFEADARIVEVHLAEAFTARGVTEITVRITDDGIGMSADILRRALQFGGSTRFGSRNGAGRYGMGLPNGALSQARRVDVFSWTSTAEIWTSYLDADEIAGGRMRVVPLPRRASHQECAATTPTGTTVVLTKCDRLDSKRVKSLATRITPEFARIFRNFLYSGKHIRINGVDVAPIDPLFLRPGDNLTGAHPYGPPLEYEVRVPEGVGPSKRTAKVQVRFAELPVERWHELSNEQKNLSRIAKHAGVSIVRAEREIDYGWYFMGSKRKENYDDWWRCEISFTAELDDVFGVTHSKQKINPTETITTILTPDIERVARELNARIRKKYATIRTEGKHSTTLHRWEARDHLLEPPRRQRAPSGNGNGKSQLNLLRRRGEGVIGLRFAVDHETSDDDGLYRAELLDGKLSVWLNENHPFFLKTYAPLASNKFGEQRGALKHALLLILASARADCMLNRSREREIMRRFHKFWSDTIAAFLS